MLEADSEGDRGEAEEPGENLQRSGLAPSPGEGDRRSPQRRGALGPVREKGSLSAQVGQEDLPAWPCGCCCHLLAARRCVWAPSLER